MKPKTVESDRVVVVCYHCGLGFVVDVAKFLADNPELGPNPTYLPATCPECYLATVVNFTSPMSSHRPLLRKARAR